MWYCHALNYVGGPQRVDGRGPHAHQDLSHHEQRHVQVVLVALLVAGAGGGVHAAAGVAGQAEAPVAEGRVDLLDLVGRRDEVGQGEEGGAHGDEDAAHRQPARPLAPPAEVADEHDHQEAPDVEAADEEARLGAPQAVALLDGGDDAAEVAGHHERLDERQNRKQRESWTNRSRYFLPGRRIRASREAKTPGCFLLAGFLPTGFSACELGLFSADFPGLGRWFALVGDSTARKDSLSSRVNSALSSSGVGDAEPASGSVPGSSGSLDEPSSFWRDSDNSDSSQSAIASSGTFLFRRQSAGWTASVYLGVHAFAWRRRPVRRAEEGPPQASSARPAELRGRGSLQTHDMSPRWLVYAGRCCSAGGGEVNLQSMRSIADTPAKEDHSYDGTSLGYIR
ncbi:hypothetical protein EYF80_051513 [Liparis tanakae]|uniref:Uncharacterized protein n=1 Tax=Liparis tanakae TaxID=230148 RepID=A0A4Z2FD71_9TELE|nr:hypothetical protein EYF80_051513 [Liparis tanakae]